MLPNDGSDQPQDGNYVPMTPLTSSLPTHLIPVTSNLALLGRQVPPPAHMGFRNSPITPVVTLTPPLRRNTSGGEVKAMPPPIHRNLKPQRKGKKEQHLYLYSAPRKFDHIIVSNLDLLEKEHITKGN